MDNAESAESLERISLAMDRLSKWYILRFPDCWKHKKSNLGELANDNIISMIVKIKYADYPGKTQWEHD